MRQISTSWRDAHLLAIWYQRPVSDYGGACDLFDRVPPPRAKIRPPDTTVGSCTIPNAPVGLLCFPATLPAMSYIVAIYRAGRIRVRVASHVSRPRWLFNECLPLAAALVLLAILKTLLGNLTPGTWLNISMKSVLPAGIWYRFGAWMLIHRSIDFRESRNALPRFFIFAVAAIKLGFCRIDDEGHLHVRQGWWSTTATVSPPRARQSSRCEKRKWARQARTRSRSKLYYEAVCGASLVLHNILAFS